MRGAFCNIIFLSFFRQSSAISREPSSASRVPTLCFLSYRNKLLVLGMGSVGVYGCQIVVEGVLQADLNPQEP